MRNFLRREESSHARHRRRVFRRRDRAVLHGCGRAVDVACGALQPSGAEAKDLYRRSLTPVAPG